MPNSEYVPISEMRLIMRDYGIPLIRSALIVINYVLFQSPCMGTSLILTAYTYTYSSQFETISIIWKNTASHGHGVSITLLHMVCHYTFHGGCIREHGSILYLGMATDIYHTDVG